MPGIFGIILKDKSKSENLKNQFSRMGKYLTHFDYYKTETYNGSDFMIGQIGVPFRDYPHLRFDEKSKRGMIFDGMMYGWRGESLQGDPARTAPVMNIEFEKFDKFDLVPELINGSFNSILFDTQKDSFYIGNSRMGNRSLYYFQNDEVIAFAPEIKAFLALDSYKPKLDLDGAVDFFNYNFLIDGKTLLDGVKRIDPATIIEIQNRVMRVRDRYWNWKYTDELDGDADLLAKQFYEKGEELLDRQMGQNENFMIALSGGMDSRLLAHYGAKSSKNINYYSHGYLKSDDVLIAREVAETLGISQKYSEIEGDPLCYSKLGNWAAWLVDGMTPLQCSFLISVIAEYPENPLEYEFLNSQFSGALNFSYGYGSKEFITKKYSYEQTLKKCSVIYGSNYINEEYHSLFTPKIVKQMKSKFYSQIDIDLKKFYDKRDYFICHLNKLTLDSKALRYMNSYDLYRYVYNWHFALIDDEIIEMYLNMPINLATERTLYIKIFCDLVSDMAKIRYEKTGVDLYHTKPKNFDKNLKNKELFRYYIGRLSQGKINLYNKHSYVQINQWYRKYKANMRFFEDILLDNRTLARGFFNKQSISHLLKKQAVGSNNFGTIATLATFELFNRYFIDGEEPPQFTG